MKKILLNLSLLFVFVCGLTALIFVLFLFKQLSDSPTFLVHVVEYPNQYYLDQTELIRTWQNYLLIATVALSISLSITLFFLIAYNFIDFKKILERRKGKKIEKLQAKLDALKKDE